MDSNKICDLCGREGYLTRHHLVPRCLHRRKTIRRRFDAEARGQTVRLCDDCHTQVHRLMDEKTLAVEASTLDELKNYEAVRKYLKWVRNKKAGVVSKRL